MSINESSFQDLLRKSSDARTLLILKEKLKVRDDDAIWELFKILDAYAILYQQIPADIQAMTSSTLSDFGIAAEKATKKAESETTARLAKAVSNCAIEVSNTVANKKMYQAIAIVTTLVTCSLLCVGYFAYFAGVKSGIAEHTMDVEFDKIRGAWANTGEGKLAHRFANSGELRALLECNRPGWRKNGNSCFPYSDTKGNIYGWRIN